MYKQGHRIRPDRDRLGGFSAWARAVIPGLYANQSGFQLSGAALYCSAQLAHSNVCSISGLTKCGLVSLDAEISIRIDSGVVVNNL